MPLDCHTMAANYLFNRLSTSASPTCSLHYSTQQSIPLKIAKANQFWIVLLTEEATFQTAGIQVEGFKSSSQYIMLIRFASPSVVK